MASLAGSTGLHCRHATTQQAATLRLTVPDHVLTILDEWAAGDLQATPEEVLEALADALCTNEDLRAYAADLLRA